MKKFSLGLLAWAVVATAGVVIAGVGDDDTLNQIAGYRQWARVTPKPLVVDSASLVG